MKVNLKKRLTALVMAGMMVTANMLPAYSSTEDQTSASSVRGGQRLKM